MKRAKILASLGVIASATAPITLITTSCSKNPYAKQIAELKEQIIKEFTEICKYPRRYGHTRPICDYLKRTVSNLGYEVHEDNYRNSETKTEETDLTNGNLWFEVPASEGYEDKPVLCLQGHMDMVLSGATEYALKNAMRNGITPTRVKVDGRDAIIAKDHQTSLGADDGIGLSLILALIKSKTIKHGPLKVIITTDEEGDPEGAIEFGSGYEGGAKKILENVQGILNLDDELENQLTACTAGNSNVKIKCSELNVETNPTQFSPNTFSIEVSNLKGGHSGDYIHEPRHNANKVIVDIFNMLNDNTAQIIFYTNPGLTGCNSIPTTARIVFNTEKDADTIQAAIEQEIIKIKKECDLDQDVNIVLSTSYKPASCLTKTETDHFLYILDKIKHGVWTRVPGRSDLVGSSQNLALVNLNLSGGTDNNYYSIELMPRGTNEELIHTIEKDDELVVQKYFTKEGTAGKDKYEMNCTAATHGWITKQNDQLNTLAKDAFHKQGKEPHILECHAYVECAEFAHIKPELDICSIGPTIDDAHGIDETTYIDSFDSLIYTTLYIIDNYKKN